MYRHKHNTQTKEIDIDYRFIPLITLTFKNSIEYTSHTKPYLKIRNYYTINVRFLLLLKVDTRIATILEYHYCTRTYIPRYVDSQ